MPSGTQAAAYYAVRALTDAQIPTNGGCFRPVTLHLPEGIARQSAIAGAGECAHRDHQAHPCGMIVGAFAEVDPERVPAASPGRR